MQTNKKELETIFSKTVSLKHMVMEMSGWGNVWSRKCLSGEMFDQGSVQLRNCQFGEMSIGEVFVREVSVRDLSSGKFQSGKCPSGEMSLYWYRYSPVNFTKFFENNFFYRTPPVAASNLFRCYIYLRGETSNQYLCRISIITD